MRRSSAAWLLTLPVAGLGVLLGHAVAYRIAGESLGGVHDYLAHAPQLAAVLATVALAAAAFPSRAQGVARVPVASVAVVGFVVQEHVERLAHTGQLPWLLTDRAFLVGLALQIPVALACLSIACLVAGSGGGRVRVPPAVPAVELALPVFVVHPVSDGVAPRACGRAPPRPLQR